VLAQTLRDIKKDKIEGKLLTKLVILSFMFEVSSEFRDNLLNLSLGAKGIKANRLKKSMSINV
jgi:hypothetical protein